jgi:hypothetical protein
MKTRPVCDELHKEKSELCQDCIIIASWHEEDPFYDHYLDIE